MSGSENTNNKWSQEKVNTQICGVKCGNQWREVGKILQSNLSGSENTSNQTVSGIGNTSI